MAEVVKSHLLRMRERIHSDTKEKQIKKFNILREKHIKNMTLEATSDSAVNTERWVINKSKHTLTNNQKSLLKKGLNFAISPCHLPNREIIAQTEYISRFLPLSKAEALKADITRCIQNNKMKIKQNITTKEREALQELKELDLITIVEADKGKAAVVLDTAEYKQKMETLLSDNHTYTQLKKDPTNSYKSKLVKLLGSWEKENKDLKSFKDRVYPTADQTPKIYGAPKIHKEGFPLRPIVSSIGSITYNAARALADILSPLMGKTDHHINNSKDFVRKIKDIQL